MSKRFSFKGGINLPRNKNQTEQCAIEVFPPPSFIAIPLQQHIGTIAHPIVKRGDHVTIGQLIGEPAEQDSLAVHSSVSGEVQSIGLFPHPSGRNILAIEIINDFRDDKANIQPFSRPWREAAPEELIQKIQSSGIAGMSGDGTPTHLKLLPSSNKTIKTLIINGVECEPYFSSDLRLIIEKTKDLLNGVLIVKKITGAKEVLIAIEDKRTTVSQSLSSLLSDSQFKEIFQVRIQPKYPNGSEHQLVNSIMKKDIPSGGSTADIGCMVLNVATVIAIHDAIVDGNPLYQRVISVCGPTIRSPKNLLVRIGTPIREVLDYCKIDLKETKKIIMGGPMTGLSQSDLDTPIIKTTTGLFCFDQVTPALETSPCINCGNCVEVCPINLIPAEITRFIKQNKLRKAIDWDIMACIECGCCAYSCPAKINLVHYIKLGKFNIQRESSMTRSEQYVLSKGIISK